jgi:hypothetical protein
MPFAVYTAGARAATWPIVRRMNRLARTLLLLLALSFGAVAHAQDCDRSESRLTPSPDGQWVASVQEEVCAGARGAAAGITVVIRSSSDESRAQRVFVTAVPRSRDDWPRVAWEGNALLRIRVPNLAEISDGPRDGFAGIRIELSYCGDAPEDRAKVAQYKVDVKQWQRDVSAWALRRKQDAATAGPRPPRPEEPRLPPGRCTD